MSIMPSIRLISNSLSYEDDCWVIVALFFSASIISKLFGEFNMLDAHVLLIPDCRRERQKYKGFPSRNCNR